MNYPFRRIPFFFYLVFLFVFSFPAGAQVFFSGLDLSGDNRLLFRAALSDASAKGVRAEGTLFIASLAGSGGAQDFSRIKQLSVFPEKIDLLENGQILQIRNNSGAYRIPVSGGLPVSVPGLSSFTGGNPVSGGRVSEMIPSGDGKWLLYLKPESPARGNLVLLDVLSGAEIQVASGLDRPEKRFPAVWSPDSRFFIYERGGRLYYYMTGGSSMPADERVRLIGDGTVNSISWDKGGDFFYLRGGTLFRVRGTELFTRVFYADFLEIGVMAGRIPFEFDPWFDEFWIGPDARSLLVSKGRRGIFYFPLAADDLSVSRETLLPHFSLPVSCSEINVFWPEAGTVTILASAPGTGGGNVKTWRLKLGEGKNSFELLPLQGPGPGFFPSGNLSPDGKLALFWGEGGIVLYDYIQWKVLDVLSTRPGKACLWTGNGEFIAGDEEKIEHFTLIRNPAASVPGVFGTVIAKRDLLCLSRVSAAGFEENGSRILAKSGDAWFVTDGKAPWAAANNLRPGNPSFASAQYRVYLEKQGAGFYANLPMIRDTASMGTFPLFVRPETGLPAAGPKQAALCFDLYDDDRGLPETLDALKRFNVRATFFLNGEFIRRHPQAVRDIASPGHEAASMFFAPINLADTRYRSGTDFILRGLARNEDEYYRVTGKELSLLWHSPWYAVSREIDAAAAKAGYITAGRDIDTQDWVSRDDEKRLNISRRSSSEMIERVMDEVKPGSVIPVRLGLLSGGGSDYLFHRVNVLIEALIREGYTLTTVSDVLNSR